MNQHGDFQVKGAPDEEEQSVISDKSGTQTDYILVPAFISSLISNCSLRCNLLYSQACFQVTDIVRSSTGLGSLLLKWSPLRMVLLSSLPFYL